MAIGDHEGTFQLALPFNGVLYKTASLSFAATAAGLALMTAEALQVGRALAPDFTAAGWAAPAALQSLGQRR